MLCPRCGAQVLADDVNLSNLVAKCRRCHEVFGFADQVQALSRERQTNNQEAAARPANIHVADDDQRQMWWRWFRADDLFLIFFCVAWDSFLVFWYSMAVWNNAPWIMIVFPIAHVAVGVGLTYLALAKVLNRTVVSIRGEWLIVQHWPICWSGNRKVATDAIQRLWCNDRPDFSNASGRWSSYRGTYTVLASVKGTRVPLLEGLNDLETAQFIKQKLGEWLALKPASS